MLDILLAAAVSDEEREIVKRLYDTYRQRMYDVAFGVLNDESDAEDAVSTAFIRIMQNTRRISDIESVKTRGYIYIVTRHAAIDIYNERRKHTHIDIDDLDIADGDIPESIVLERFEYETVDKAIGSLNENYRNILTLRYFYDLPFSDIARSLGISEKAAKSRLYRARESLLKKLGGKPNG